MNTKQKNFIRLWIGTTASGLATWALPFVLGLAVIHEMISPAVLGLLLAARTAGFLIAVPVGGLYADKVSNIYVIRAAGILAALASIVLAFTATKYPVTASAAATVVGMGQGACRPAFQAQVPLVVDPEQRQRANALITIAVRTTTLLGPAVAAALARIIPVPGLICVIGGLWLISALCPALGSQMPKKETSRSSSLTKELADGFAEASRHRWFVAGLSALVPVIAFGYSTTNIILPMVSHQHYGSDVVFAAATIAYTAGALIGAVVMTHWHPAREGAVAFLGLGLYTLAPLMLLIKPSEIIIIGSYVVIGMGLELFNVPWFTATQREIAPEKLARVSSVDFLVSYGLAPIGLALFPIITDLWGVTTVLIVTSVLCALSPLLAALVPGGREFHEPDINRTNYTPRSTN